MLKIVGLFAVAVLATTVASQAAVIEVRDFGDGPAIGGTNEALGDTVTTNAAFHSAGPGTKTVDGSLTNFVEVKSAPADADLYLEIDLGGTFNLDEIVIYPRGGLEERMNNLLIETLLGGVLTQVVADTGATGASGKILSITDIPVAADTLRITRLGTAGTSEVFNAAEVEVYGVVPEPASLALLGLGGTLMLWRRSSR